MRESWACEGGSESEFPYDGLAKVTSQRVHLLAAMRNPSAMFHASMSWTLCSQAVFPLMFLASVEDGAFKQSGAASRTENLGGN